jgi:hypothetical protein
VIGTRGVGAAPVLADPVFVREVDNIIRLAIPPALLLRADRVIEYARGTLGSHRHTRSGRGTLPTLTVRFSVRARGAAWLAHWTVNPEVAGSSPVEPAINS